MHGSILITTITLVWLKLVSRSIYYITVLKNLNEQPSIFVVGINSITFVLMSTIVVMINKLKLHLIYVRSQKLAGFCLRQTFTFCYILILSVYGISMYLTVSCNFVGKLVVYIIKAVFLVSSSIVSGFIARKLWRDSNFGYQRKYRKRVV